MPQSKDERIKTALLTGAIGGAGALIPGTLGRVVTGVAPGVAKALYEGGKEFTRITGIDCTIPDDNNKNCKR